MGYLIDKKSLLIFACGLALYLSYFLHSSAYIFLHDAATHAEYIKYIAENYAIPAPDYTGAARHPPLFYVVSALFYNLGEWLGAAEPIEYSRFTAVFCYLTFIAYAALTIRAVFPEKSQEYYISLALLVFWPVGVTKIGIIHCDVMTYAAGMATIYYLVRWLQISSLNMLSNAFIAAGFAVLAKNSGAMMIIISGFFLLAAMWKHRQKFSRFFSVRMIASILFALACAYATFQRPVGYDLAGGIAAGYGRYVLVEYVHMFLYFDPLYFVSSTMINPHNGEQITAFWPYYLRSILLGDYIFWKALAIVWVFGIVWLSLMAYILFGLWKARVIFLNQSAALYFLLAMAALYTGLLLYMFAIVTQPNQIADARYVYPIVCVIVIFYGKVMQWHREAGRAILYKIGNGLALGFVFLTLALFIAQDYLLAKIQ